MSNYNAKDSKHNHLLNAELFLEQGHGLIDGTLNNTPPPEEKPLDKVKEPPKRPRSIDREDR